MMGAVILVVWEEVALLVGQALLEVGVALLVEREVILKVEEEVILVVWEEVALLVGVALLVEREVVLKVEREVILKMGIILRVVQVVMEDPVNQLIAPVMTPLALQWVRLF